MGMSIGCKIIALMKSEFADKGVQNTQGTEAMAIVEIASKNGNSRRQTIFGSQEIFVELGDRIKCTTGKAEVVINPTIHPITYKIAEKSNYSSIEHQQDGSSLHSVVSGIARILDEIEITDAMSVTVVTDGKAKRVTNDMARQMQSTSALFSKLAETMNQK